MGRNKYRADHRADTRGAGLIGLPKCVWEHATYKSRNPFERAVFMEILGRFNGYNNGEIGVSVRQIAEGVGTTNFRRISRAIATLCECGLLAIGDESIWQQRKARTYRITFLMSGKPPHTRAASNEYLHWKPQNSVDHASADETKSADHPSATPKMSAEARSAVADAKARKTVIPFRRAC